ncbi:MAG: HAMP domain-containing sensor histidine kinase [Lachnospiraceae bacterium]|nr:HAMP domain-containing sensor histidine kinase [Lachnospiraceae bacterium]
MNEQSIKKLKNKFLVISMCSFIAVMVIIGGLIYIGTLTVSRREAHEVTQSIIDNGGELPSVKTVIRDDGSDDNGQDPEDDEDITNPTPKENLNNFLKTLFGSGRNILSNKDQWYATRYFSVIFDRQNNVTDIKADRIASVDLQQAKQYALAVSKNTFSFGSIGNYYYQVSKQKNRTIVVFVDSTNQIRLTNRILYMALILLGFGSIISFLVLRALSYKVIAPEIRNAEQQKQFITNASHELKTPLAVIKANTQVQEMMNGKDEWSESTMRQVDRMTGLIQNLVTIVRAEEKEDAGDRTDTDISEAIRDTVKSYAPVAENAGETLNQNIGDGIHMNAVESQIRQLATLLIDNAIKYCDEKGTIDVTVIQKGRGIRLSVSNSYADGKNVDYSKFFERFYRADQSHNVDKGGYGIGLSIAESLVKQYNGSINASWKDGVITFDCILK